MLESSLKPFNEAIEDSDWSDSDQSDGIPQLSSDGTPDIEEPETRSKSFEVADEAKTKKPEGLGRRTILANLNGPISAVSGPLIRSIDPY